MNLRSATNHLAILRDTLGMDGKTHADRNLFVGFLGTQEHSDCMQLVAYGYLRRLPRGHEKGGDKFVATSMGKAAVNHAGRALVADWVTKHHPIAGKRFHLDGTPMEPNGAPVEGAYHDGEAYEGTPEEEMGVPF